ncbi:type II secretion system protein N [Thalassotalea euphylliae]|uniref:Type II secretion system protein N n=1 Tax=Thalassotalea euphylliae TaxID=1655234 RepID=A0A3E0UJ67_9GAMM|nr:type II secretion system protein N [Thalassotalea euphylliae]REL36949.1 type II secretion system protein N [Thalassotalea euphylliae]
MTLKIKIALAAVIVAAYLVFVIALTPAALLVEHSKLPKGLALGEVSETIWSPQISAARYQGVTVNQISADVSPWSLLALSPAAEVKFGSRLSDGPEGQGYLALRRDQVEITDFTVQMPAGEIAPLLPLPIELDAFGQAELTIDELTLAGNQCVSAKGRLTWQRAAVNAFEQSIELGSFKGEISCQQGKLAVKVLPDNRLGLQYTALLGLDGRVSGQGYLTPGNNFPAQLRDTLPFIGNPDAQGRYELKF